MRRPFPPHPETHTSRTNMVFSAGGPLLRITLSLQHTGKDSAPNRHSHTYPPPSQMQCKEVTSLPSWEPHPLEQTVLDDPNTRTRFMIRIPRQSIRQTRLLSFEIPTQAT